MATRRGTDLAAKVFLLVLGIVAYNNFVKGTLGAWFGAKFLNRAGGTIGSSSSGPKVTGNLGGGVASAASRLRMPVQGTITGSFGDARSGHSHAGIDIAAPAGTPIGAAGAGTVTARSSGGDCGNRIDIAHSPTLTTRYCHLATFAVKMGDKVSAGQTIGTVGSTGDATGPHLHFEVRVFGGAVDPSEFLAAVA